MVSDTLAAALRWRAAGCSIIRTAVDGSKASAGSWQQWQHEIADELTLRRWFGDGYPGIGVVCGAVSGNLEMLELEGRALVDGTARQFWDCLNAAGLGSVKDRIIAGYSESSPSGGLHLMFRVDGTPVTGNTKLAQRPDHDVTSATKQHPLIETRGEGGMVVVAPSHGPVHPSGRPWVLLHGEPATLAVISADEYRALHRVAATLDEMPLPAAQSAAAGLNGLTGYDHTDAPEWAATLEPGGWTPVYSRRGRTYWRRPGKNIGVSAVTGGEIDQFWCWSTSVAGVEAERSYTRFGLYAALWTGGDHAAARRSLGSSRPIPTGSGRVNDLIMSTVDAAPIITPHQMRVLNELDRIKVNKEAHQLYILENTATIEPVERTNLTDSLLIDDPDTVYRVDRIWPAGGNIIIAGQAKVGKSILLGNLIKCLADGGEFLSQFETEASTKQIVLIDNELDEDTLRRRLRALHIDKTGMIDYYSFRGKITQFNILDPKGREKWAKEFRDIGAGVIILDCLRPIMDAFGLDENRDAGVMIGAFEALRQECGATEGLIVHHMGHSGERSRGDSRLIDWPDANWYMTREDADDPASDRYFRAYGRNVDVPESQLWFNELSNNHLTIPTLGEGKKKAIAKKSQVIHTNENDALKERIRQILSKLDLFSPGLSKNEIHMALGGRKSNALMAVEQMILAGEIEVTRGGRSGQSLFCKLINGDPHAPL